MPMPVSAQMSAMVIGSSQAPTLLPLDSVTSPVPRLSYQLVFSALVPTIMVLEVPSVTSAILRWKLGIVLVDDQPPLSPAPSRVMTVVLIPEPISMAFDA